MHSRGQCGAEDRDPALTAGCEVEHHHDDARLSGGSLLFAWGAKQARGTCDLDKHKKAGIIVPIQSSPHLIVLTSSLCPLPQLLTRPLQKSFDSKPTHTLTSTQVGCIVPYWRQLLLMWPAVELPSHVLLPAVGYWYAFNSLTAPPDDE